MIYRYSWVVDVGAVFAGPRCFGSPPWVGSAGYWDEVCVVRLSSEKVSSFLLRFRIFLWLVGVGWGLPVGHSPSRDTGIVTNSIFLCFFAFYYYQGLAFLPAAQRLSLTVEIVVDLGKTFFHFSSLFLGRRFYPCALTFCIDCKVSMLNYWTTRAMAIWAFIAISICS